MAVEDHVTEYKSIQKLIGPKADVKDLAKTCVCLANAKGGTLAIGIEDKTQLPPADQRIDVRIVNEQLRRLAGQAFNVALASPEIKQAANGGEYFTIRVLPSASSIATTSDGRIYMRFGEECLPVRSEDLVQLVAERGAFQWELQLSRFARADASPDEVRYFVGEIMQSPKVSEHVKDMLPEDILAHYNLVEGDQLTNLGVLWLGTPHMRARIRYAPTITYLVFDEYENRVRKEEWFDYRFNPKRLLADVMSRAAELHYTYEVPGGLLRVPVRHYPEPVIRELLANALAHRLYTNPNEVVIRVYPDGLEITNPGGLPMGVTPTNILHKRVRRNTHLMTTFQALGLMEGEGSGYDKIYEELAKTGKPLPKLRSDYEELTVTVQSREIDTQTLLLIDHLSRHYQFKQKEIITLGLIARYGHIPATDLSALLQLDGEDRLRRWLGRLPELGIVQSRNQGKATRYFVNPSAYASIKLNVKPSLKTLEPHRLRALLEEDLRAYPDSKITEIHARLEELEFKEVRREIYKMVREEIATFTGAKTNRRYSLAEKKRK